MAVLLVQEDNQTKQVDTLQNPGGGDDAGILLGCPSRWNVVEYYKYKKSLLGQMLIGSIWLPPVSKAQNGPFYGL
jgi:hypothetical protein